ncbi:hypothetical protein QOZ80_5AG0381080 [Eleusine coracana subsp. coracana]|nr:hypothetical protein QOZ80_5AG0381080 [Eleusine coracana subsp. coracana]
MRNDLKKGLYLSSDFYPPDIQSTDTRLPYVIPEEAYMGHYSGRTPASAEAVAALLLETSGNKGECSVCLKDFDISSKLRAMPCSHCFHEQCLFTWLRHNHVCPLCRFPLPTEKHQ